MTGTRSLRSFVFVAATVWSLAPAVAPAQTTSPGAAPAAPVAAGAAGEAELAFLRSFSDKKVRVVSVTGSSLTGTLRGVSATGLTLHRGGRDEIVPLGEVQHVEKTTNFMRSVGIVGSVVGFFVGGGIACAPTEGCSTVSEGEAYNLYLKGGVIGTAVGAVAGALVGAKIDRDRRARNVIYRGPAARTVGIVPVLSERAAGVSVSLAWP